MSILKLTDCEHQINASDANLESSKFEDVRLSISRFHNALLEQSQFNTVDLSGSTFDNVSFVNTKLNGCRYEGMTIEGISVELLLQNFANSFMR